MKALLQQIASCTLCAKHLPHPPRPVVQATPESKIIIIGQAPGLKVHTSGIPWNDASGNELRQWLGVTPDQFYDRKLFALVPMGFCYPGKGKSGDLPPRPECAPQWHAPLLKQISKRALILLIGQYAQHYYLGERCKSTLTETVKNYKHYLPEYLPLVHPSPRNRIWMKRNPWFEDEVIPVIQKVVKRSIG